MRLKTVWFLPASSNKQKNMIFSTKGSINSRAIINKNVTSQFISIENISNTKEFFKLILKIEKTILLYIFYHTSLE